MCSEGLFFVSPPHPATCITVFRKLFYIAGNLLAAVTAAGLLARFVPPDVWWPPAVIALLLPGLLFLTMLFTGWMLYRRRWSAAAFPGLVLLAALPLLGRLFAFSLAPLPAADGATATVLTANVRGFKDGAWQPVGEERSVAFLRDAAPDVLLLQEARAGVLIDPIRQASGLGKRHQPRRKTVATYADNPTFIADVFPKRHFNGFLVTDVETDIGTLRVINVHLQSNMISGMAGQIGQDDNLGQELDRAESMLRSYGSAAATRTQQAEDIRKYITESPYPVIVGGDFNDVPSSYTYQRLLTDRLRDAWPAGGTGLGTTFTGPLPFLRIDFLLIDKSLTIHEVERVETGFSDHRGLRVVISK